VSLTCQKLSIYTQGHRPYIIGIPSLILDLTTFLFWSYAPVYSKMKAVASMTFGYKNLMTLMSRGGGIKLEAQWAQPV
jgi:hypothetical protein